MTSNKKPERCGFYWRKGTCCLIGYNVSSVEKYSDGATCFERFELKISQISLTAANLSVSHSCSFLWFVETMWTLKNLKRIFDINAPKTKWMSFGNSISVIWRFTPSIPQKYIILNNASISNLSVFLTHVYMPDSLKLSLRCKRAIVLFILVFVQSTVFSMIWLSKYKWKVSSTFSILFALEFGAKQLIYPKWYRILAVY